MYKEEIYNYHKVINLYKSIKITYMQILHGCQSRWLILASQPGTVQKDCPQTKSSMYDRGQTGSDRSIAVLTLSDSDPRPVFSPSIISAIISWHQAVGEYGRRRPVQWLYTYQTQTCVPGQKLCLANAIRSRSCYMSHFWREIGNVITASSNRPLSNPFFDISNLGTNHPLRSFVVESA